MQSQAASGKEKREKNKNDADDPCISNERLKARSHQKKLIAIESGYKSVEDCARKSGGSRRAIYREARKSEYSVSWCDAHPPKFYAGSSSSTRGASIYDVANKTSRAFTLYTHTHTYPSLVLC